MSKQVTKAAANRYCQARLTAAQYDERLAVRCTAVDRLPGVTEASLKKYELDITTPPNDVVILMADAYNAPELMNYYCATECPIGCRNTQLLEIKQLDRLALKLLGKLGGAGALAHTLLEIVEDGVVSEAEKPQMERILAQLDEISHYTQELHLWMQKQQ